MEKLIDISGQSFYYSTLDQLIETCESKKNLSVIISGKGLEDFINRDKDLIGSCIDHLIVISDNLIPYLKTLQEKKMLIVAANNMEEAITFGIQSDRIAKEIICVPEDDSKEGVNSIIELIIQ